jgi:hypothetical protein
MGSMVAMCCIRHALAHGHHTVVRSLVPRRHHCCPRTSPHACPKTQRSEEKKKRREKEERSKGKNEISPTFLSPQPEKMNKIRDIMSSSIIVNNECVF